MLAKCPFSRTAKHCIWIGMLYVLLVGVHVHAKDVYKIAANQQNVGYWEALLTASLNLTEDEFGPYEIVIHKHALGNERHKQELLKGELINARVGLTTNEREAIYHAVKIPVRKGLLNYRLLLAHKSDLKKFEGIETLEQLKTLKVGLVNRWVTSDIFDHHAFNITRVIDYHGLFRMLQANRYDYTVRGVNEIYTELDKYRSQDEDLVVVPNLGLLINSPSYFFISKQHPRLAKRLETGLETMVKNGEYERIFLEWHQSSIDRANLSNRKFIKIENPFLPVDTPIYRPELWFKAG